MGPKRGESIFGEKFSRQLARAKNAAQLGISAQPPPGADALTSQIAAVRASVDALPPVMSLADLKKAATKLDSQGRGKAQRRDRAAKQVITKWLDTQPGLGFDSQFSTQFEQQPGPPGAAIARHVGDQGSSAVKLLGSLNTSQKDKHNLDSALDCSFRLKCRPVSGAEVVGDCAILDAEEPSKNAKKKPQCHEVGICLCSENGCKLYTLSQRFLNATKIEFPYQGTSRVHQLKASKIFVLLKGSSTGESDPASQVLQMWHIGIHYLSPFRPTFRKVNMEGGEDTDPLPVTGTNEYFVMWKGFQQLDLSLVWVARFYQIRESNRPLGAFQPAQAWLSPIGPDPGTQFWPPPSRGPGKARVVDALEDDVLDASDDLDPDEPDGAHADVVKEVEDAQALNDLLDEGMAAMLLEGSNKDDDVSADAGIEAQPKKPKTSSDSSSSSSDSSSSPALSDSDGGKTAVTAKSARETADEACRVPGGVIRFYKRKDKCFFTATCGNTLHGDCILTRQATAVKGNAKTPNMLAKGRPLGYLVSWLSMGCKAACDSKPKHWDKANQPTFDQRAAARKVLNDTSSGRNLLLCERAKRDGEADEPLGLA
jgi:hypothetical protein